MPYYSWQMYRYVSKITGHSNSYVYALTEGDNLGEQISYFPTIESFLNKRCIAYEMYKSDENHIKM